MDYIYLALEWDPVLDTLEIKCAYTKKYNLQNWLRKELEEKTYLSHLTCYRIRGGKVTEIDPYETIAIDPGEL